jgi:hypothetical protein
MSSNHENIIPQGAVYIRDGKEYTEGQPFPKDVKSGDIYKYDGYEYCYNGYVEPEFDFEGSYKDKWKENAKQKGWGVMIENGYFPKNLKFNDVLPTINGKPITNMDYTYHDCVRMMIAPNIPDTVKSMVCTFSGCRVLIKACSLPEGVEKATGLFEECPILREYQGSSKETLAGDFSKYPIPSTLKVAKAMFYGCTSVLSAPDFSHCTQMEKMSGVFTGCVLLNDISNFAFPSHIKPDTYSFNACYSLSKEQIEQAMQHKKTVKEEFVFGNEFFNNQEEMTTSSISADKKKHQDFEI